MTDWKFCKQWSRLESGMSEANKKQEKRKSELDPEGCASFRNARYIRTGRNSRLSHIPRRDDDLQIFHITFAHFKGGDYWRVGNIDSVDDAGMNNAQGIAPFRNTCEFKSLIRLDVSIKNFQRAVRWIFEHHNHAQARRCILWKSLNNSTQTSACRPYHLNLEILDIEITNRQGCVRQ